VELRRYFAIIRRRWFLVALTLVAGLVGAYLTTPQASTYSAQTTLYVGSRQFSNQNSNLAVSGDTQAGLQTLIQTFSLMIRSRPIAADAVKRAGVQRSAEGVVGATLVVPELDLIRVKVTDPQPAVAQKLADGLADAFVDKIAAFEPNSTPQPGEVPQLPAYVFERAILPTVPNPTGGTRHAILGLLFGLVVGIGVVFLLEYLDITIKSAADAERRLELPVLGIIPFERATTLLGSSAQAPALTR
jgi:capsular polysaccharide biosynthesis protein